MIEEDLTAGEKLFLKRRREGRTQNDKARQYRVSAYTYRLWEKDHGEVPSVKLRGIEPPEHFTILRLRAGFTQQELARRMGISRKWLWKMENGIAPLHQAVSFWCEE